MAGAANYCRRAASVSTSASTTVSEADPRARSSRVHHACAANTAGRILPPLTPIYEPEANMLVIGPHENATRGQRSRPGRTVRRHKQQAQRRDHPTYRLPRSDMPHFGSTTSRA